MCTHVLVREWRKNLHFCCLQWLLLGLLAEVYEADDCHRGTKGFRETKWDDNLLRAAKRCVWVETTGVGGAGNNFYKEKDDLIYRRCRFYYMSACLYDFFVLNTGKYLSEV